MFVVTVSTSTPSSLPCLASATIRGTSAWQCGHECERNRTTRGLPSFPTLIFFPARLRPTSVGAVLPIAGSVDEPILSDGLAAAAPLIWTRGLRSSFRPLAPAGAHEDRDERADGEERRERAQERMGRTGHWAAFRMPRSYTNVTTSSAPMTRNALNAMNDSVTYPSSSK